MIYTTGVTFATVERAEDKGWPCHMRKMAPYIHV